MNTLEKIKAAVTGPSVLTRLLNLLRSKDHEFAEVEAAYLLATEALRRELPPGMIPAFNAYLAAHEEDITARLVCAGYLGYRVNIENFHHPIGIDFVRYDTADYTRDHIIGHFPANEQAASVTDTFLRALPEDWTDKCSDIENYFIYLECTGPKLAHYAGYIIANHLLPEMEPGYRPDHIQTSCFTVETEKYLGFLPF